WGVDGWIHQLGALDFAGGTVVHISSGVSALAAVLVIGRRRGYPREPMIPHNLTMTVMGAGLLWFGWFGFNAGSALEANGSAALAFMNTYLATACAVLTWMGTEWLIKGKPSMLGAASGAVAGLVAITPAAGNVGIPGAFVIGLAVGPVCFWGVTGLKKMIRTDDALDVFGVHALGGTFGALTTGIFNAPALGGPGGSAYPGIWAQLLIQAKAVGVVIVWTAVVAAIGFYLIKWVMGLRVSEDEEREGLDITVHGERAYDM
ncbi:MAG: ammonium transporter, partial [Gammaproteobacteria bacterium]|nr:ammonium transporter [Gammaproteobacteria bacterium]